MSEFWPLKHLDTVWSYIWINYFSSNFPAGKFPPYETAIRNISLILANDHFSQGMLRPNLPNVIEVGGLQVKTKPYPLPQVIIHPHLNEHNC